MQHSPKPTKILAIALLVVLVGVGLPLLLYGRSLRYSFARDDGIHLQNVERWTQPMSECWSHFQEDFWRSTPSSGLYRPVTAITIHTDARCFGLEPTPLRMTNLLVHALTVIVFLLFARTALPLGIAAFCAAVAAVHPLCSEPVLEVVSRSESQAALCTLLAAFCVHKSGKVLWLSGPLWLLALLSKESAIGALPALLYLVSVTRPRCVLAGASGFAVALLLYLILRRFALGSFVGLGEQSISPLDNPLVQAEVLSRIRTAFAVLARYLALWIVPARLSADYSMNAVPVVEHWGDPWMWAGILATVGILRWLVVSWRERRILETFGLLLAVGTYLPASNFLLPIGTIQAERLFYSPGIGLLLALGSVLARFVEWRTRTTGIPRWHWIIPALVVALLGIRCFVRVGDWKDNATLFAKALEVVPQSARVQCNVGFQLVKQNRHAEAQPYFERALAIFPDYGKAHSHLALCLVNHHEPRKALEHWRAAALLSSSSAEDVENFVNAVLKIAPTPANRELARELVMRHREMLGASRSDALLQSLR